MNHKRQKKRMLCGMTLMMLAVSFFIRGECATMLEPMRIIMDVDIGCEGIGKGALAMLRTLADAGEAEIAALSLAPSKKGREDLIDVVDSLCEHGDIPIASVPGAVKILRRVLSCQKNKSVVFVSAGPADNLRDLLDSPPDEYSKYDGRTLVAWKTKRLVVMSCKSSNESERNAEAEKVFSRWPTEVVFGNARTSRFRKLKCNNPDAVYWAKGGVFGQPAVGDFCGNGRKDLYVGGGWINKEPWSGTFLLRNLTGGIDPVYAPPERVGEARVFDRKRYRGRDGNWIDAGKIHPEPMRFNKWQEADFDGDGIVDVLAAVGDGKDNGFWTHDNYSRDGKWLRSEGNGYIYIMKGLGGKGDDARYAEPEMLKLKNGKPLWVRCNTSTLLRDWDGDGDLDLIVYDFMGNVTYFANTGTRTKPTYAEGRLLTDERGKPLHGELCLPSVIATDWDDDGRTDMMFTEEDARVGYFRNTGTFRDGLPVFEHPRFLRGLQEDVWFGSLSTPYPFDWDGDGDEDIICGNAAGQIAFIENLSGARVASPKWASPILLEAPPHLPIIGFYSDDPEPRPIRIRAGYNGSIQGPNESEWGYVCLSVADWDGDGLPDIMANNIWGKIIWWRNIGTRAKPKLAAAQGVEVEWNGAQPEMKDGWYQGRVERNPRELIIPWRSTPMMTDWNRDGLTDLVALDHDGYLCLYERRRKGGRLVVLAPKRVFWDDDRKIALHPAYGPEPHGWKQGRDGGRGRRKMALCDWDGDGRTDIVMNGDHNAVVYRQTGFKDGLWHFACGKPLDPNTEISSHDPQPAVCDFDGNGIPDLLLGVIDGRIYHYQNPRVK